MNSLKSNKLNPNNKLVTIGGRLYLCLGHSKHKKIWHRRTLLLNSDGLIEIPYSVGLDAIKEVKHGT